MILKLGNLGDALYGHFLRRWQAFRSKKEENRRKKKCLHRRTLGAIEYRAFIISLDDDG